MHLEIPVSNWKRDCCDYFPEINQRSQQVHSQCCLYSQVDTVVIGDEVDSKTQVAKASRPSDSVQVCFGILWEIEVDDHVDRLDVNTSCEQVCKEHRVQDETPNLIV